MKNILAFAFLLSLTGFVNGQKIIEKTFAYTNQEIEMDVKFARHIEIKTWDKAEVYFKAEIIIDEDRFIDKYELVIDEKKDYLRITSKPEAIFKAFQEYGKKTRDTRYWYNSGDLCRFFYTLYVPKNSSFKVSSINGDLESEIIEGDFMADLINGNIDIKTFKGDLDLRTINGEIDLVVKNTSLKASTIHGEIYADESLKLNISDQHVGQKVSGSFDSASSRLHLETINGNMYLRRQGTSK
ncbi:MAG: hypothetical protein AAFU57_15175 [Bacteroidota bacterium]